MSLRTTDELLDAISELRTLFPDWRMGRLVANLVQAAGRSELSDIWEKTLTCCSRRDG